MTERSRTLTIETTGRAAEVAQEVARLAREILGSRAEVWWFGSWPKGRAQLHSDLDIAVSTGQPIPPERMMALREAVEELPTLYSVDVMDLSTVGQRLRKEIVEHGVKL